MEGSLAAAKIIARSDRTMSGVEYSCLFSLRWHYPDQVLRVEISLPLANKINFLSAQLLSSP